MPMERKVDFMACDCLGKLHKELTEKFGEVYFTNTVNMHCLETGKTTIKPEPLRFEYPALLKDGTRSKSKTKRSFIQSYFCQFCGKQY